MPRSTTIVPPSRGEVLAISLPLIVSNLSVPLLGMVDTAVVGHMGSAHFLGAVAIVSSLFSALFLGLNFLRMATTGLVSQALGAGDGDGVRVALLQGAIVALGCALLLLLLQWPLREPALELLGARGATADAARAYFDLRIWSAPAALVNYVFVGWLVGMARTRAVLAMTLSINLSNIVLDVVFVYGLNLGVEGVAAATVFAECIGTAVAIAAIRGLFRGSAWRDTLTSTMPLLSAPALAAACRADGLRAVFSLNANLLLRTLALQAALLILTARGARLGEVVLAANAVLLSFQHLVSYGLDGFAHAAEALVGRALGARHRPSLVAAVRYSFEWGAVVAIVGAVGLALGGTALAGLMTDQPEVRAAVQRFLPWLVLSPLVSVWSFIYDGIFVGATAAREMRNVMLGASFIVYVPAVWLLAGYANHGLWAAFTLFMLARAVGMHAYFGSAVLARTDGQPNGEHLLSDKQEKPS